ncbi:unnamed protein product, partial [Didymodactylos carnosus]
MIPTGKELLVSSPDELSVLIKNTGTFNCDQLRSSHIESATRLLQNASEKLGQNYNITIIKSTNTDLLLLAISVMNTSNPTWVDVSPGNSKNEVKTLDVAEIYREFFIRYMVPNEILLTLHALSGTKLTSHIRGISKKTIFEAFLNNTEKFEKLQEFGRFSLSDGAVDAAERLLLNAAKSTQETLDNARGKAALSYMKKGDFSDLLLKLLPTSNAWLQHCQRANVMINIWGHALETTYVTPQLQNNGFILQDESLQVQWIS